MSADALSGLATHLLSNAGRRVGAGANLLDVTYVAKAPTPAILLVDVPPADLRGRLEAAMAIYVAAMGYTPASGVQRGVQALRHADYDSFRCRAAMAADGQMLGFAYGYTSLPGQWWHDLVARAVDKSSASVLNRAFELSELHVLPTAQGHRIGERLLQSLAEGLPHRHMVLSTPEGENRAWRLYRRLGFTDLARNHLFPGDSRPFGVLAAPLPFEDPPRLSLLRQGPNNFR